MPDGDPGHGPRARRMEPADPRRFDREQSARKSSSLRVRQADGPTPWLERRRVRALVVEAFASYRDAVRHRESNPSSAAATCAPSPAGRRVTEARRWPDRQVPGFGGSST